MVGAADWPHDQFAREQPEDRTSAVRPRLARSAEHPFRPAKQALQAEL
jgi:hypothetical protein